MFEPSKASSRLDAQGTAARQELNDGWYQWVADNCLRDCAPDSMLATMVQAGLDADEARSAITLMNRSPGLLAARKFQQIQRKLESVLANQQKLWELAPHYEQVEKRSGVSRDEFVERYAIGSRPVVLTDVTRDWPAMRKWSPQYLKEHFGHLEVQIQAERNRDPKFEQNKLAHQRMVRLGDFVDQVTGGGATNDYYMTANNEVLRRPEFAPLLEDIGPLPDFCRRGDLARSVNFWFGPAGTNTPLHHDTLMLLHTQVVGRKRWRFISPLETPHVYNYFGVFSPIDIDHPDLARYPLFRGVKVLDVVVEAGETVFLPLAWWHQVSGLDVSLSVSYTNIDLPNDYEFVDPQIRDW
ncbi:MAG TPA: cupin-like domain-containing protein [Burkholderiaceae bacterium]|nr:cupin-like domain-containing protein [Burkholderiaceae bacterium]